MTLSGIDQLILLADAAKAEDEHAFERAMLIAHDLASDLTSKIGERITWGFAYLQDTRADALEAIRDFAGIDPTDLKAVIACQQKVRDYMRVAGFADRILREAASAAAGIAASEPSDDGGVGGNAEESDAGDGGPDA